MSLAGFLLIFCIVWECCMALSSLKMSNVAPKKVLLVGGTRFSGLALWKELQDH